MPGDAFPHAEGVTLCVTISLSIYLSSKFPNLYLRFGRITLYVTVRWLGGRACLLCVASMK